MADPQVVDMDTLAVEEAARNATPPKLASSVIGIQGPTAEEETRMREIFSNVTMDDLDKPAQNAAPQGQPPSVPSVAKVESAKEIPAQMPAKFLKPDGTVDEEKLKASSEQLGKAIEQKQKTIDEMLAEYKEKEKQFTELGHKTKELQSTSPNPVSEPPMLSPQFAGLTADQIRAQLLALNAQDPIAFAVEIARAVSRKEATDVALPALQVAGRLAEQERDSDMRKNLLSLAERDSRVQEPALYAELINELNSDPAYFRLKNPIKNAWNEVKERLRLGEPTGSAQPSQASSPTLGRGVPPSVSSFATPMTPQSLNTQVSSLNPFSPEGKKMEDALKQMAEQVWRG